MPQGIEDFTEYEVTLTSKGQKALKEHLLSFGQLPPQGSKLRRIHVLTLGTVGLEDRWVDGLELTDYISEDADAWVILNDLFQGEYIAVKKKRK